MQSGRASKTAEFVCMGRAMAHGVLGLGRFDDPTAIALLPDELRREVIQERAGGVPVGVRASRIQAGAWPAKPGNPSSAHPGLLCGKRIALNG